MKNIWLFWYFAVSTALFHSSCHSASTRMTVLQPAEINLPEHINVIATLDRSKPSSGWANTLEGLITGEDIFQDRSGRRRALDGLRQSLTRTPRFRVVETGVELEGSKGGSQFPPPLEWGYVQEVCKRLDAQALLTIELFDSDSFTATSQDKRKEKDKDGNEYIRTVFNANRNINIKMGWRLYDVQKRQILDQYVTRDETNDGASGDTRDEAVNRLGSPKNIVSNISFRVGELYGMRIAPVWITVTRQFYTKVRGSAKNPMQRAANLAKAGEWEKAAETWRGILANHQDGKARGRAAHNMAVAAERAGKLESAFDWAQKAFHDFGHRPSQGYMELLRRRIDDQRRLDEQMRNRINP